MAVLLSDLFLYGSAVMPDSDGPTQIGGAIDLSRKVEFTDVNGLVQAISSAGGDTTQSITISYRDSAGVLQTEAKTLNGQSTVAFAATMERLLKAIKSATTTGDVAVEAQTATRASTAQGGDSASITLDAGASAVDDFFNGEIVRLTSGTGVNQIRQIIDYDGTTKKAFVSQPWSTPPDATSGFRIAKGFFFDKTPSEIDEVRRPFFDSSADAPGGSDRKFYDKVFYKNNNGATALTVADVSEQADPAALIAFALETSLDGTGDNGVGNNRQVAPSAGVGTFDSTTKGVIGGTLGAGVAQGIWLELTLDAGEAAQKTSYTLRLKGSTV